MHKLKLIFIHLWVLILILWRKYILRKKPAETHVKGQPISKLYMNTYDSIEKLRQHNYVDFDLDTPRVFLSLECYKAFCCDTQRGLFVDDVRALAFLDKIRFYLNFQRHYVAGLQDRDEYPPVLEPDKWIDVLVSGSDSESILLVGRWKQDRLELRAAKDPHPTSPLQGEE